MINKEKNKPAVLFVVLSFVFYLVAMIPVLRSDYMGDDRLNYIARGYAQLSDVSLWQFTLDIVRLWFHQNGRPFFFAWYPYIFFDVVGLKLYKFLIVCLTFVDGLLLGMCLSIRNCIKRAPKSTVPGQHRFGF